MVGESDRFCGTDWLTTEVNAANCARILLKIFQALCEVGRGGKRGKG